MYFFGLGTGVRKPEAEAEADVEVVGDDDEEDAKCPLFVMLLLLLLLLPLEWKGDEGNEEGEVVAEGATEEEPAGSWCDWVACLRVDEVAMARHETPDPADPDPVDGGWPDPATPLPAVPPTPPPPLPPPGPELDGVVGCACGMAPGKPREGFVGPGEPMAVNSPG